MTVALIIVVYLIGYVLTYRLYRKVFTKEFNEWTSLDRARALALSLCSWLGFISVCIASFDVLIDEKPVKW